jgi:hypothetical protein
MTGYMGAGILRVKAGKRKEDKWYAPTNVHLAGRMHFCFLAQTIHPIDSLSSRRWRFTWQAAFNDTLYSGPRHNYTIDPE